MRDVDKAGIDAPPRDTRDGGASDAKPPKRKPMRAATSAGEPTGGPAWFSSTSLRRRIPLGCANEGTAAVKKGAEACQQNRPAGSGNRRHALGPTWSTSTAIGMLILAVCAPLLFSHLGPTGGLKAGNASVSAPMGYMQALLAQYDQTASGGAGGKTDASAALTASMVACAAAASAPPAVAMGLGPARAAPADLAAAAAAAAANPLSKLDLDCIHPVSQTDCSAVAEATNLYEDGQSEFTIDLAGYLASWESYAASPKKAASAFLEVPSGLDSLALDCDATPAACVAAAAASNTYEEGAASESAVAAAMEGAKQYLQAVNAAASGQPEPGSVHSLDLDCESPADAMACIAAAEANQYEGDGEHPLERMRMAEQAAPWSLRVHAMGLDCWGLAKDGTPDPVTAAECVRSQETNRYEAPVASRSHAHAHSHGTSDLPIDVAIATGPDGLPVSGPVEGEYSWLSEEAAAHAAAHAATATAAHTSIHNEPAESIVARRAADIRKRQEAEAWFARNRRAQGGPRLDASAESAPAQGLTSSSLPEPLVHFKNPCNNPNVRKHYKSPANHLHFHDDGRVYYKSPANSPSYDGAATGASTPAGGVAAVAVPSVQAQMAMALCAAIVGAAVLAYMQQGYTQSPAQDVAAAFDEATPAKTSPADLATREVGSPHTTVSKVHPIKPQLLAGCPSPERAAGGVPSGPLWLGQDSGDVDVVPSGAVDSPRRAGGTPRGSTPLFGRATTPLGRLGPRRLTPEGARGGEMD